MDPKPQHDTPAQRDEKATTLEAAREGAAEAIAHQKALDAAVLVVELARMRRESRLMYGVAIALNLVTSAVVVATLT